MSERRSVGVVVTTVWTAPDAPREHDRPLVAPEPDLAGWCAANDRESRSALHGRTLTQALLGEPVDVIEEHAGWAHVVLPWQPSILDERGYPGWVPTAHLADVVDSTGESATVRPRITDLRARGGGQVVSCGTVLPLVGREGADVVVGLPGGEVGWLPASEVVVRARALADGQDAAPVATRQVAEAARGFLGIGYVWGGTSGWGVDCSGLIHLAHRVHGVRVPRDAGDQQEVWPPVSLGEVRADDLLFFARPGERAYHVGVATSASATALTMLHAPESGELVEDGPLAPHREQTLVSAGRLR